MKPRGVYKPREVTGSLIDIFERSLWLLWGEWEQAARKCPLAQPAPLQLQPLGPRDESSLVIVFPGILDQPGKDPPVASEERLLRPKVLVFHHVYRPQGSMRFRA